METNEPFLASKSTWAATSFVDTLFGAMMHNEVDYGTQGIYTRVQA